MAAAAGGHPGTPSASAISGDSDLTGNGEQWWLPQPHPSLDENHSEWRPAAPMAEALQCSVCKDLLKEAITAAECGHSYCYDCIDRCIMVGGKANFCPVCNILFGPNPWEHHKLKYDFMLDSLVRKVFPRPKLDAALEARRLEREEATRQAKAKLSKRNSKIGFGRVPSSGQLGGSGRSRGAAGSGGAAAAAAAQGGGQQESDFTAIPMMMHPMEQQQQQYAGAAYQLPPLPKPYMRVPANVSLQVLRGYLCDRLVGKRGEAHRLPPIVFKCAGQLLTDDAWTAQDVLSKVWLPYLDELRRRGTPAAEEEEIMVVYYGPAAAAQ